MQEPKTYPTRLAGINIEAITKGEFFTAEQVEHAFFALDHKAEERVSRFKAGDLKADPLTFASTQVIEHIQRVRQEIGRPVVGRSQNGGIRILTDAEAVPYLNSQAEAGLRKHRNKTGQLFGSIAREGLTDHERRTLEGYQQRHAFILASTQGARTESRRLQRKGLTLPDYREKA
jgi:hypothetical protein